MNDTIEFTPEAVKEYLVAAVRVWRKRKLDAPGIGGKEWLEAVCYVDAFQSVHMSLFGTLVPQEDLDAQP